MAPVGFYKKLKTVASSLGKGLSWVNENIAKPLGGLVKSGMEMLGAPEWAGKIYDTATNGISYLSNKLGYQPNNRVGELMEDVVDIGLDTQRSDKEKKYRAKRRKQARSQEQWDDSENPYKDPFKNSQKLNVA